MSDNNIKILQSILLFIVAIVLITKSSSERYEFIGEYNYKENTAQFKRVGIFDKQTGDIYIATYKRPEESNEDKIPSLIELMANSKNLEEGYYVRKANFKKMHKDSVMKKK
jgi:hypothetical protein